MPVTPKKWRIAESAKIADENLRKTYHPVTLQLLSNRGLVRAEDIGRFFDLDYEKGVADPFLFLEMEKAAERIVKAKNKKEKIAIFGDYDADGVTATAVVFETLSKLGFSDMEVYIPDRQLEGYGMNMEAVEYLKKQGVNLIITVDCGVKNIEEVQKANELGVDVIITDHHHVPDELPEALAIINPHQKNCGYPFSELSGVGVAFKLAQAIQQKMDPKNTEQLKWLLDLVAIGTIADCVPLLGENRIFARFGLLVLSKTRRPGFLEMFKVGRINIDENNVPDAQKISFMIAPRINAAGRMDHASVSYDLMVEKDTPKAREMALEIESKNQERQKVTAEIVREIRVIAENSFKDKKFIFAANEHWPVGILGLVAGKISEEFNKPTVVLQKQELEYVGSLRSIPQINIVEALEKCADTLIRFGGHSQAAGLRVAPEKIENFYQSLAEIIEKELDGKDITPETFVDAEIQAKDISWELLSEIRKMEPFGEGNKEPIFVTKNIIIEDMKIVGNGNKHLKMNLRGENSPKIFDAIGFGMGEKFPQLKKGDKLDIVFNLREDEWNGNKKIQLRLIDLDVV